MTRIEKNERFVRNIYKKGPFEGHAFICTPPALLICELPDNDYTLSDKPVENWVPWVVKHYDEWMRMAEELGDDSVPVAKLSTGTHIFAAAFGSPVNVYVDNNPCAVPFVTTAKEADRLEEPVHEDV